MTEIEHLQKVILSIAKDIDKLCKANNIEYYLLGGSAIGAIRHKGFIPWDDDLDIIMTNDNYQRFIKVCKSQLDNEKYVFQEGLKDWPLNFSKIRLKGTSLKEYEAYVSADGCDGIYVDIFKMDNVINDKLAGYMQYFCAKYYLCYQLSQRKYHSAGLKKRIMMFLAFPMRLKFIKYFVVNYIEKYNKMDTPFLGFFYGRTKWRSGVVSINLFGKPLYVPFEDTKLPVPECYHEYLTQVFGDYMKLPPIEQRKGLHLISIDFGRY